MIRWFEQQHPAPPVIPADPVLRFLANLIEDYADEWLWRPAMWWRWMPKDSRFNLGHRIAREVLGGPPGPVWLKATFFAWRQRRTWLWGRHDARQRGADPRHLPAAAAGAAGDPGATAVPARLASEHCRLRLLRVDVPPFRQRPRSGEAHAPDDACGVRMARKAVERARQPNAVTPLFAMPEGSGWGAIWKTSADATCRICTRTRWRSAIARRNLITKPTAFVCLGRGPRIIASGAARSCSGCSRGWRSRAEVGAPVPQPYGGIDALLADGEIDSGLDEELKLPFVPRPPASWWHRAWVWLNGNPRQARA